MADYSFLQNPVSKKWIIAAPRRASRPVSTQGHEPWCPFCVGRESNDKETYRVPVGDAKNTHESIWPASTAMPKSDWAVRVVHNKYPFAPIHEVIIHSPDHKRSFAALPLTQVELVLQTYRHRYNEHHRHGQVYIFHNHGRAAGESLPHPHTQLVVIPEKVYLDMPVLSSVMGEGKAHAQRDDRLETEHFTIFCPKLSSWPDEVWVAPKRRKALFGELTDKEIQDLALTLSTLVHLYDLRHGKEFAFNFYIYPGEDWYLRLIPRVKTFGGFEVGTGVMVNTQSPSETMRFIKEHFHTPNVEKILHEYQAEYHKTV